MALSGNKEVVFDLDAAAFSSDDFRMYQFKVKRCPRARPHDWTQCPFAHPGEKAKRRDPRRYRYSGTACPEFRRNGCCRRGDACPFAHGVFECWLHPSRYRTQMCTDGANCKRRVCFFAHTESELRKPEEDPVWVQQQLQAELAAEQQLQQQVQALKIFSALLASSNPTPVLPGAGAASSSGVAGNGLFEMLKNTPVGSLASLLGLGGTAAAPAPAAPATPEDKLRGVLQQLQQGQNSLTLLQLISLLEKVQQQQPSAAQPATPAAAPSAATGSEQTPTQTPQATSDIQLKLAQQLANESLQAQFAQLQKASAGDGNKSALDVLSLLTNAANSAAAQPPQEGDTTAATAPAAASTVPAGASSAVPPPEASSSNASSSSSPPAENAAAASALSSLAGLDPAVAALLQQPALLQLAAAATAAAKEPTPPPNPLVNLSALEGLLSQLSLAQLNAAVTPAPPTSLEPSTPTPPTPTTPAVEHNAVAEATPAEAATTTTAGALEGSTTAADGSKAVASDSAGTPPSSGELPNKDDVLRNAKALVEMLNAKGTPPAAEKVAVDAP